MDESQERLWITEPRRATCLATVTDVRGEKFTLDRALFAPRSRATRHPQYADEGTVWWDGEKRRLGSVHDEGGLVWYTLRGTVPEVGVQLQCQLDQEVRALSDRAHTAMHLVITALQEAGGPPMVADPEVKGGGHFRLELAWPMQAPELANVFLKATQWAGKDLLVKRAFAAKDKVHRLVTKQVFQPPDPAPGGDVLPLVQVGDVCVYPCDGTHVERTSVVGAIRVQHAEMGREAFVVVGRVEP